MRARFAFVIVPLGLLACGGPAVRPVPSNTPGAARPEPTREWYVEEAGADSALGPMLYLDVTTETPTLTLTPNVTHQTRRRTAKGWEAKRTNVWGTSAGVYALSPKGERWGIDTRGPESLLEFYLTVFRGNDAHLEGPLGKGSKVEEPLGKVKALYPSIAIDAEDRPHVCYSVFRDDNPVRGLFYATRAPSGGVWKSERIAETTAETRCTIMTGPKGLLHVVHGEAGKTIRVTTRTPAGATEVVSLGEGTFAAERPAHGAMTIALAQGHTVKLFRRDDAAAKETWKPSPVVLDAPAPIGALALGFDAREKARLVAATKGPGGIIGVASEDDGQDKFRRVIKLPKESVDAVAIAVDERGAEHVAFIAQPEDPHTMPSPFYARPWRSSDNADNRGTIAIDREALTEGCSRTLDVAFGAKSTTDDAQRQLDDAACWLTASGKGPSPAWLGARCEKGDAAACFVGGMVVAPRAGLGRYHAALRWLPSCPPEQPRCARIWEGNERLGLPEWPTPDVAEATKLFGRACELGRAAACIPRAQLASSAKDPAEQELLERACGGGIDSACLIVFMHVYARKVATSSSEIANKETLTKRIEESCEKNKDADACNLAAFLEENASKANPPDRFAEAKHVTACEGGSASSCARLVLKKGKRPVLSSTFADFVFEQVEKSWVGECREGAEDACLALVAAYETGWSVKADAAKAKELLGQICDAGKSAKACARLGKAPAKK